jgi:hypothetical protein
MMLRKPFLQPRRRPEEFHLHGIRLPLA